MDSKRCSLVLAVFVVLVGWPRLALPQSEPGEESCARWKQVAATELASLEPPVWLSAVEEVSDETDVEHYALVLEIVPAAKYLRGTNEIKVKSLVEGLDRFRFWLDDNLSIDALAVDGVTAAWQRLDEATVEVPLARPRAAQESFVVSVAYSGNPRLDTPGIYFETRRGQPEVTTRSEPWFAYVWWPVKEDNRDKATADITLVVPENLVGVSNGLLVETTVADGKRRFHWRTAYPTAPYLFCASVTNYTPFSSSVVLDGHTMPLQFFIWPESDTPDHRTQWLLTRDMLKVYSEMFGLYPFVNEKYGLYNFAHGGMEHQTISGQTGYFLELTIHELAHQWWGDWVTCATWHDIWLNEGFATYAEALWIEHDVTTNPAAALKAAMDARRPADPSGSVYVWDTVNGPIFSDLTYRKGAWVLHMLRHLIGDASFFSTLRRYGADHAYGTATTDDFRAAAEAVSGRDLRWFFDDWVYAPSVPLYELAWRQIRVDEQQYLDVYIGQAQADGSAVRMSVPLRVGTGSGSSDVWVFSTARNQHFLIPFEEEVDSVELDPEGWILTQGQRNVPYVKGPPRIFGITPLPHDSMLEGVLTELTVTFHMDVVAKASDFRLVGRRAGEIPLALAYSRATRTAVLTPTRALPADRYTFTVLDSITATGSTSPLDGELGGGRGSEILPSGDGAPGGDAVVEFSIQRPPSRHLTPRR